MRPGELCGVLPSQRVLPPSHWLCMNGIGLSPQTPSSRGLGA